MKTPHIAGMGPLLFVPFTKLLPASAWGHLWDCETQSEVSESACVKPPDSDSHQLTVYNWVKPIRTGGKSRAPASTQAGGMWASRSKKKPKNNIKEWKHDLKKCLHFIFVTILNVLELSLWAGMEFMWYNCSVWQQAVLLFAFWWFSLILLPLVCLYLHCLWNLHSLRC